MFLTGLSTRGQLLTFITLFALFSITGYTQDIPVENDSVIVKVDGQDIELKEDELDRAADVAFEQAEISEEGEGKELLYKIGEQFRKAAKSISKVVTPDEAKRQARKNKRLAKRAARKAKRAESISNGSATRLQRILYGAGKGASAVSTAISRPFVHSAGFLTGFFKKEDKLTKNFLQFMVNHEKDFDPLYRESGTIAGLAEKTEDKMAEIMAKKSVKIISDAIYELTDERLEDKVIKKTIGIAPYSEDADIPTIGAKIKDVIFKVDQSKFSAALINEHPEYQELRGVLGDISKESLADMLLNPNFELSVDKHALIGGSRLQLHEGLIAFSTRLFVPKLILGVVSKGLGSVALGATLIADAGAVASVLMCTVNKKNIKKLEDDSDQALKDFCSYVVNRSAYLISKSRAKGYLSGTRAKSKFKKLLKGKSKRQSRRNKQRSKALNQVQMM